MRLREPNAIIYGSNSPKGVPMTEQNTIGTATTPSPERDSRLDRLLALADGVFAIALTLLAVELTLPEAAADLLDKLCSPPCWRYGRSCSAMSPASR